MFWDIGANIGVYTLYAGLRGDTRVVAFEPAGVNYFLLAANCELNRMNDRVDCLLAASMARRASATSRRRSSQRERRSPSAAVARRLSTGRRRCFCRWTR